MLLSVTQQDLATLPLSIRDFEFSTSIVKDPTTGPPPTGMCSHLFLVYRLLILFSRTQVWHHFRKFVPYSPFLFELDSLLFSAPI